MSEAKKPKKPKKTTSKKQVVVGKQQFINKETGEVETFNVVNQYDQDFNFDKLWIGHILESLDIIGNKKIKVLNWLLANKDQKNQVIGTQQHIADKIKVSRVVVNQTIKMLETSNLIKKVQDGVYLLNPEVIFKGGNSNRMNVLLRYTKVGVYDHKEEKQLDIEDQIKRDNQNEN